MATPHLNHYPLYRPFISPPKPLSVYNPKLSQLTINTGPRFKLSINFPPNDRFSLQTSASVEGFRVDGAGEGGEENIGFSKVLKRWVVFLRSVFPGGSWWKLCDSKDVETMETKVITVMVALRGMWGLLSNDKWVIFVAFGALIVAALSEISIPSLLAASIFSAQSGETLVFSRNSWLLLLLCFTSGICSGLRSGCFAIANMILVKRLRETLYAVLLFQDIYFFDQETVGGLTSRLGADCQRLSNVIGNDINLISRNVLQGTGALISLLVLSWPLTLSTVVLCSVLSTIFMVYGQYQKKAAKFTQEFTACANEVTQETFSLMRTVRVNGTEITELKRYTKWLDKLAFISVRESVAYGFWNLSFYSLYRSTQVFAVLLGGMSVLTGHVSAEQLTKYVLYCEWLIYATWRVGDSMSSFLQSVGASEKVFHLMELLPSEQFLSKGKKLQRLVGHIEFVDVSFHYPSREMVSILEHVNFSVQASEVVAIVGVSGSGKSTLVNILLRLYEPTNGQILIDGFPLTKLDIRWLRENIGYVGQEPHLFHMDIKSNIGYGCSKHIKQEDIEWASKQAYAHEFITSLPNGYDTLIDDNLLSGGEKQRIAVARAIVRDPAILILDEATSALDAESEHYVKGISHAFRKDMKTKRTVIVIAHRLSTVKTANRIVVMDGGQLVEMGDHKELLHKDGLYARLFKFQTDALA